MLLALMVAAALPSATFKPGPVSEQWKQVITKELDTRLFDGESARYKWPDVRPAPRRDAENFVYCGWVNAKNRMGAYTGWKPYAVFIDDGRLNVKAEGIGDSVFIDTFCGDFGYDYQHPPL